MRALNVLRAGPGVTVQDLGRPGYLGFGLSRGGAMDRLALFEGAALLGQAPSLAALEMAAMGGVFEATADLRIALTGAPMPAEIDGRRIAWNASHMLERGARLSVGLAREGVYGYLHVGGGFETPERLGARSAHLAAGLGRAVAASESLPVAADQGPRDTGLCLSPESRCEGGTIRVVPGPQTPLFAREMLDRFTAETFARDSRGNRMGVRFLPSGESFASEQGLSVLSEVVVPGDVQVGGDGTLFVLLAECQTTGGYPRIGTVIQADLPRVVQAQPGDALSFAMVTPEEGAKIDRAALADARGLRRRLGRLVRRPEDIADLLSYQLIGGVTAGDELEERECE